MSLQLCRDITRSDSKIRIPTLFTLKKLRSSGSSTFHLKIFLKMFFKVFSAIRNTLHRIHCKI